MAKRRGKASEDAASLRRGDVTVALRYVLCDAKARRLLIVGCLTANRLTLAQMKKLLNAVDGLAEAFGVSPDPLLFKIADLKSVQE